MEEKKPKIKNARLRGLIIIIGSAVLAGFFKLFPLSSTTNAKTTTDLAKY